MHRSRSQLCVAAALLLGASQCASAAKLYKWVDENGNVSYSQQKPVGVQSENIEVRTGGPSSEESQAALESLTTRANEGVKDREFAATASEEIKNRDERLKKNCEVARENKRILETAPRVQDKDADGNPYFVDDASRAARIATAEEQVKQFCQ